VDSTPTLFINGEEMFRRRGPASASARRVRSSAEEFGDGRNQPRLNLA